MVEPMRGTKQRKYKYLSPVEIAVGGVQGDLVGFGKRSKLGK